jgi:hypothetical protein
MKSALNPADLYHTGIVVPDLEEGMARFATAAGYEWAEPQRAQMMVRMVGGDELLSFHYVYSASAPYIELVEQIPGVMPWSAAPTVATHHIGYWCDDVPATSARLAEAGFPAEAQGLIDGEPALFAFHRDRFGARIEIVERSNRAAFEAHVGAGRQG